MPAIILSFDTKLSIFLTNSDSTNVGWVSDYTDQPHPGTSKTIEGWLWDDRFWPEETTDYPTTINLITNPDLSGVEEDLYQSGIGDNNDLLIEELREEFKDSFSTHWTPVLEHGHYHVLNRTDYLYADSMRTNYLEDGIVNDQGYNIAELEEFNKDTIPISARIFVWDKLNESYSTAVHFRQMVHFSGIKDINGVRQPTYNPNTQQIIWANVDTTEPEFIVTYDAITGLPILVFNEDYTDPVGNPLLPATLEIVGQSDGEDNQIFHSKFSPMDPSMPVRVFVYVIPSLATEYTVVNTFSGGMATEVKVDKHLGLIQFGSVADDNVSVPSAGYTVAVHYTKSVEIDWEPRLTPNKYTALESKANVNPVKKYDDRGFVILRDRDPQVAYLKLEAELPIIAINYYGPLYLASAYARLKVTATDKKGRPVEDLPVTISILDSPAIGRMSNGTSTIQTVTDSNGIGYSFYNPPRSINEIGEIIPSTQFVINAGKTELTTTSIKVSSTQREVYLYKVFTDDPVQGIPLTSTSVPVVAELLTFYNNYLTTEGIFLSSADWEHVHRLLTGLLTPVQFNQALRNGRKQIVITYDATALNPHSDPYGAGSYGAFIPFQPETVQHIGPTSFDNRVIYDAVLDTPGIGDLDSYFLISPTDVNFQATAINELSGKTVKSNIINIQIAIAPSQNGTVYVDDFNAIPPGLLQYLLTGADDGRILPLGFRLRSSGITLAAALGAVTYIDPNRADYNRQPSQFRNAFEVRIV